MNRISAGDRDTVAYTLQVPIPPLIISWNGERIMMVSPALRRIACRVRSATRYVTYREQAAAQHHVLRLSRVSPVPPSPFSVFRRSIFIQVMSVRGSILTRG